MNIAEILAQPLDSFDVAITKNEVYESAEIAMALIEKSGGLDNEGRRP